MDFKRFMDHIESVIDKTQTEVEEAVNSFSAPSRVGTWDEFQDLMVRFHRHVENRLLRTNLGCDALYDVSLAGVQRYLRGAFGQLRVAFEIAKSGQEGGLLRVLRTFAQAIADDSSGREIGARVASFLEGLSFDEERAIAREYIERYGHLVSSELMEGSPAYVQANLQRVLAGHPQLVQKVRHTTRGYQR